MLNNMYNMIIMIMITITTTRITTIVISYLVQIILQNYFDNIMFACGMFLCIELFIIAVSSVR